MRLGDALNEGADLDGALIATPSREGKSLHFELVKFWGATINFPDHVFINGNSWSLDMEVIIIERPKVIDLAS